MKVVGLTGGIGSGKTTVAKLFAEQGIPVFIADDEGKKLTDQDPEIRKQIRKLFGDQVYNDNKLDRGLIAAQVFADQEKLEALNAIIHPAVAKRFENWKQLQSAAYIIYEAAILFEKGGDKKCDLTILVIAGYDEKVKRLQARDQSTEKEIRERMSHQWSDEKKAKLADFIIENKDLLNTRKEVLKIHHILLNPS